MKCYRVTQDTFCNRDLAFIMFCLNLLLFVLIFREFWLTAQTPG